MSRKDLRIAEAQWRAQQAKTFTSKSHIKPKARSKFKVSHLLLLVLIAIAGAALYSTSPTRNCQVNVRCAD